jgi:DNA-binding MarR family transcriptional regulator
MSLPEVPNGTMPRRINTPTRAEMRKMQAAPLQTNQVTVDVLQRLFFSETKPKNLKPIDISILGYLILRRCADHEIVDSHLTVAERVCSDRQTVARSLDRLEKLGWITVAGRGRGLTKAIAVNVDAFPAAQPIREKITQEARELTHRYFVYLQKLGRRKFPKNWLKRQIPSAQRILTRSGGDLALAASIAGFALSDLRFKARAKMSLYHLLSIWSKVVRAHGERTSVATLQHTGEGGSKDVQCNAAA